MMAIKKDIENRLREKELEGKNPTEQAVLLYAKQTTLRPKTKPKLM